MCSAEAATGEDVETVGALLPQVLDIAVARDGRRNSQDDGQADCDDALAVPFLQQLADEVHADDDSNTARAGHVEDVGDIHLAEDEEERGGSKCREHNHVHRG